MIASGNSAARSGTRWQRERGSVWHCRRGVPNLNSYLERWVGSTKEERRSRLILFGENPLRHVVSYYLDHFHHARNHPGKGNRLLFPTGVRAAPTQLTAVRCCERLGGLLKYYYSRAT